MKDKIKRIQGINHFIDESDDDILEYILGVTVGIYRISPYSAEFLLENYNDLNRRVKRQNLEQLVVDMKAGRFIVNGESLIFEVNDKDDEIKLSDGQHRLLACIESGKDIYTYVTFSMQSNVMGTIDTGSKRTAADALIIGGAVTRNGTVYAAVGRALVQRDKGLNPFHKGAVPHNIIIKKISNKKIKEQVTIAIDMTKRRIKEIQSMEMIYSMVALFSYDAVLTHPVDVVETFLAEFFTGCNEDGIILGRDDIITMYRKRVPNVINKAVSKSNVRGALSKAEGSAAQNFRERMKTTLYNIIACCFNDYISKRNRKKPSTVKFDTGVLQKITPAPLAIVRRNRA